MIMVKVFTHNVEYEIEGDYFEVDADFVLIYKDSKLVAVFAVSDVIRVLTFNEDNAKCDCAENKNEQLWVAHLESIANQYLPRQKISAIKAVREASGWGLREAKEFVDQLMDEGYSHNWD